MIEYNDIPFPSGYTAIVERDKQHPNMLMDFGILKISKGDVFRSDEKQERAYLLMNGAVEFVWPNRESNGEPNEKPDEEPTGEANGKEHREGGNRSSLLEENPHVLHVSSGIKIEILAKEDAELCVQKVVNDHTFKSEFYNPSDIRSQRFGEGTMQNTSTRIVRTVFDADNSPDSGMVIGEVVNYPGKWSSYPPHNHPQPEVYHYRFPTGTQGFGFGEVGDRVFRLKHQATLIIEPWVTHPQTAAPGYPMYYIWMIPHLPDAKFGSDSRQFIDEHKWLLNQDAQIWPDK